MRAVVLEMPPQWIEERRRLGHDIRDEVWDGVLHMVPQPGLIHQLLAGDLERAIYPRVIAAGFLVARELSVYATPDDSNYRVPDLVVFDRANTSQRGVEQRAAIVIEILSPKDESRDKLPFYASCSIREVWLIDPLTRSFEVLSIDDGYETVRSDSAVLGVKLSTVDGPKLRVEWSDGAAVI